VLFRAAILLFLAAGTLVAAPLPGKDPVLLGPYMGIAHDRGLTIKEVTAPDFASEFKAAPSPIPNFGMTDDAYWTRFDLANPSPSPRSLMVEVAMPHLDDVRLYVPEGRLFHEYVSGRNYPFSTRAVAHENYVFPVELPPYFQGTLYMRFEQEGTFQLPVYLWDADNFHQADRLKQLVLGSYYGVAIVMLIYNLFLWIAIRERAYIYYVLAILFTHFLVVFHINGFSYVWFFPESPVIAKRSYPVLLNLAGYFSIQFVQALLLTKERSPRLDRGLVWLRRFALITSFFAVFASYFLAYKVTVYLALVMAVALIASATYRAIQGDRIAVYYVVAWSVLVAATVLLILRTVGVAPVNFATDYGVQVAASLEVVLLSLALGERINEMRREKDRILIDLREKQQSQQLAVALRQLTAKISSTLNHNELIEHVKVSLPDIVRADQVRLLLKSAKDELTIPDAESNGGSLDLAEMTRAMDKSEPSILQTDRAHLVAVPVHSRSVPRGLLLLRRSERFPQDEVDILRTVASEIGMVLENIRLFSEMHEMATVDSVTGLLSRAHFMNLASVEFERSRRYKRPLSALMIDIDYFKQVNDLYGHQAGDEILTRIATLCKSSLREVDIIGRYGGDEFSVMLPETPPRGARDVAERIRKRIEKESLKFTGKGDLQVTLSLGTATVDKKTDSLKTLLSRADAALLEGKKAGKNRVAAAR